MAEADTVPTDFLGTATGAPDGNVAEARAATQVLAVATKCIVQPSGLFAVFLDVP